MEHGQEHSPLWTPRRVCSSRGKIAANRTPCNGEATRKMSSFPRHHPYTDQDALISSMSTSESMAAWQAQKKSSHLAELQQLLWMSLLSLHGHSEPSSLSPGLTSHDAARGPVPQGGANEHFAVSREMLIWKSNPLPKMHGHPQVFLGLAP